jgi:3-hydroxymyristoyl/3-hydroxydecanoyl-(acyl carrier protein) dehydratase
MNDIPANLPCAAIELVHQRPPMLLVDRLLVRDRRANFSVVEALVPGGGPFVEQGRWVLPEYFVELLAQAMAAVNGYDDLIDGEKSQRAFLVGIEEFSWLGSAGPGDLLMIEVVKSFEFGPVTVMAGKILNETGQVLASGEIKAWVEK